MLEGLPEYKTLADLDREGVPDPELWLPWRLDRGDMVLWCDRYGNGRSIYEIELQRCRTSSRVLDWICQVAGKSWALDEPAVLHGLIVALNDILEPQANLCPWSKNKEISVGRLRQLVSEQFPELPGNHEEPELVP